MRDELTSELASVLSGVGLESYVAEGAARFRHFPTVAIRVDGVTEALRSADTLVVHVEVVFAYNVAVPASAFRMCVSGIGSDRASCMADAARTWGRSWAPPLFSVLYQSPVLNAEWLPSGDPLGIPDWDAFSSPYILRTRPDRTGWLSAHLQEHPPLDLVRDSGRDRLDRSALIQTLSLFIGRTGDVTRAEVRINDEIDAELGELLAAHPAWPGIEWGTVQQCFVLLNPSAGHG